MIYEAQERSDEAEDILVNLARLKGNASASKKQRTIASRGELADVFRRHDGAEEI